MTQCCAAPKAPQEDHFSMRRSLLVLTGGDPKGKTWVCAQRLGSWLPPSVLSSRCQSCRGRERRAGRQMHCATWTPVSLRSTAVHPASGLPRHCSPETRNPARKTDRFHRDSCYEQGSAPRRVGPCRRLDEFRWRSDPVPWSGSLGNADTPCSGHTDSIYDSDSDRWKLRREAEAESSQSSASAQCLPLCLSLARPCCERVWLW